MGNRCYTILLKIISKQKPSLDTGATIFKIVIQRVFTEGGPKSQNVYGDSVPYTLEMFPHYIIHSYLFSGVL